MKKFPTILGSALAGLCLVSCDDNHDKTVAELTGKLLDVQNKLGAMEAMQNRLTSVDSMAQRLSALEAAQGKAVTQESSAALTQKIDALERRLAQLESQSNRTQLEGIPGRLAAVEEKAASMKPQDLSPLTDKLDKLTERIAVLESKPASPAPEQGKEAEKEATPIQRTVSLLRAYSILGNDEDSKTFLGHVTRVEHEDATMTDFPILAELLDLGTANNPVPLSAVTAFVEAGADVNAPDAWGATPLMHAVDQADPEVVRYLLGKDADASATDPDEVGVLFYALRAGNGAKRAQILKVLHMAGCDMNKQHYPDGHTPLVYGLYANVDPEVVAALVECGADVEAPNRDKTTLMDCLKADSPAEKDISPRTRSCYLELWERTQLGKEATEEDGE